MPPVLKCGLGVFGRGLGVILDCAVEVGGAKLGVPEGNSGYHGSPTKLGGFSFTTERGPCGKGSICRFASLVNS